MNLAETRLIGAKKRSRVCESKEKQLTDVEKGRRTFENDRRKKGWENGYGEKKKSEGR